MTMLFVGMIIGSIIGLLIGGFSTAWYDASKEIARLNRERREEKNNLSR